MQGRAHSRVPSRVLARALAGLGFCGLCCTLLAGCEPAGDASTPPRSDRVNVIWILLDALRSDHLSVYGYARETSPSIDALARRGVVLEDAWSQASSTLMSVPSFMTGRYEPVAYQDPRHLDIWFLRRPPPEEQLVSSIFAENGYETAMFSASPWYSAASRLGRSFASFARLAHGEDQDPRDRATNPQLFRWIEQHADRPFFLYVHSLDTHEPRYRSNTDPRWLLTELPARDAELRTRWSRASPPFDARDREQIRALYDGGIRVADAFVGEIVAAVRELGLEERTVVVVSADHGENLAEDGKTIGHASNHSVDELFHVPVVLAGPGVPVGRRLGGVRENVDIVPTLVELAGLESSARFDGRSLVPAFRGQEEPERRYAYARIQRAFDWDDPDRLLIYADRKFVVRKGSGWRAGELHVKAFARPDLLGARRPVEESPERLAAVRANVRDVLRPLRDRVRDLPREVPPTFEFGHATSNQDELVVQDRVDERDGRWSDVLVEGKKGTETIGTLVEDRELLGFPSSEELPELRLGRNVPNGRYRVSASIPPDPGARGPVAFRFRVESEADLHEFVVPPEEARRGTRVALGLYGVEDGRFDYRVAAPLEAEAATARIGRLRFEVEGAEATELPTEAERREDIERLRRLGYLE